MLFREMNGRYYENSKKHKHRVWQKFSFNVTAIGTCIYHGLETVKVKVVPVTGHEGPEGE